MVLLVVGYHFSQVLKNKFISLSVEHETNISWTTWRLPLYSLVERCMLGDGSKHPSVFSVSLFPLRSSWGNPTMRNCSQSALKEPSICFKELYWIIALNSHVQVILPFLQFSCFTHTQKYKFTRRSQPMCRYLWYLLSAFKNKSWTEPWTQAMTWIQASPKDCRYMIWTNLFNCWYVIPEEAV